MRTKSLVAFLIVAGPVLFACKLVQPQPVNKEPTQTFQVPQVAPTEPPPTAQEVIASTPTKTSKSNIDIKPGYPLVIPRSMHTATLLSNGKILLVGGSLEPDDFVADEEIFDPITGSSGWTAPLHTPRHGHTATLLSDGRVLVVGGYNLPQQWISDAEIYDPATDIWTVISPLYSHGVNHTATLLKDGRVLVVGGCIGSGICTERVEIFDPKTNSWAEAAPLSTDRASHTAQLLNDGRVLVAGGTGMIGGVPMDGAAVIYDPQKNTWKPTGDMITPRHMAQSILLSNGRVLVTGGILLSDRSSQTMVNNTEIYDPVTNTWNPAGSLSQARYAFILAPTSNGKLLAIGGTHNWDCCWTENSFVKEIEIYDPHTDQWSTIGELPQPRAYATGIVLPYGRIWIAGGQSGQPDMTFPPDTWLIVTSNP